MVGPPLPSEVLVRHGCYGDGRLLNYLLPPRRFSEAILEIGVDRRAAWSDYFVRAALLSLADGDALDRVESNSFDVILCRCLVPLERLLRLVRVGGLIVVEVAPATAFTREV